MTPGVGEAIQALAAAGVIVGFTNRTGGVSRKPYDEANISTKVGDDPEAVQTNRRLQLDRFSLTGRPLATVRQAHTATVVAISTGIETSSSPISPLAPPVVADGMVTRQRGVVLMVGVADCAPVVLVDAASGVIGLLHVGWRGLVRGLVAQGVTWMAMLGARPHATLALIGPSIGPCCFPVQRDVWTAVRAGVPAAACTGADESLRVDLRAGITHQLHDVGVTGVSWADTCTADNPERYFSARRQAGATGVQAGLACLL